MNAAKINEDTVQFVAVTFVSFNSVEYRLSTRNSSKPYFYVDPLGLEVGDLALIHNGSDLGVVRVARRISAKDPMAAARIKKPVICKLDIDHELLADCYKRIEEFKDATADLQVQAQIDSILGIKADGEPSATRKRLLGKTEPVEVEEDA